MEGAQESLPQGLTVVPKGRGRWPLLLLHFFSCFPLKNLYTIFFSLSPLQFIENFHFSIISDSQLVTSWTASLPSFLNLYVRVLTSRTSDPDLIWKHGLRWWNWLRWSHTGAGWNLSQYDQCAYKKGDWENSNTQEEQHAMWRKKWRDVSISQWTPRIARTSRSSENTDRFVLTTFRRHPVDTLIFTLLVSGTGRL